MPNKGLLSMPPNSQPTNPTHGGTAASQTSTKIKLNEWNNAKILKPSRKEVK